MTTECPPSRESPLGHLKKSKYRPEIDGLRAFAVAVVIVNHFNKDLLPGGYLGVDIFFVISGYVITSSLYGRPSRDFKDFLTGFYERRIKRLVPALSLFVLITGLAICLFDPTPAITLRTGLASLFGLSNLYLLRQSTNYFAQSTELNAFTHTWSLGVEEQFYFLFPVLIWFSGFGRQTKNGARNLFLAVGILTIASLICFLYLYPTNQSAAYFLMPTRFWEMAAGCLIFVGFLKGEFLDQPLKRVPPLLVIVLIIAVMYLPMSFAAASTVAVVALSSILIACLRRQTAAFQFFTSPQVVSIGLISYSLYLWHWGVLSISRWTVGISWWSVPFQVVLMLALAASSYRWIEKPLRRGSWFGKRWKTLMTGGGVLVAVSGSLVVVDIPLNGRLFLGTRHHSSEFIDGSSWDHKKCAIFWYDSVVPRAMADTFSGCWMSPANPFAIKDKAKSSKQVFAFGNSYTLQLMPAFKEIHRLNKSINFNVVTMQCPASAIFSEVSEPKDRTEACKKIFKDYVDWFMLASRKGDILLVAESLHQYAQNGVLSDATNSRRQLSLSSVEAQAIRARELIGLSSALKNEGRLLIFVSGIPYLKIDPVLCGHWFSLANSRSCDSFDDTSSDLQKLPFKSITTSLGGSTAVMDIFSVLIKASRHYNGSLHEWYFSRDHINRKGALIVAPYIRNVLEKYVSQ